MSTDEEMADIGGTPVPKALKLRWDELIAKNASLKNELFEAKTTIQANEGKVSPDLTAAQARIAELEGTLAKAEHGRALSADGVDGDEDLYDYLQYQYGKVAPEEGKVKPTFSEWYGTAKGANGVIKAAIAAAAAGKAPEKVTAPKLVPPKLVPERKPASTDNAMDADGIAGMDPDAWKANKAGIRKQLFGS